MDAFLGTIIAWAPNFAPRGWLFCNGQELQIRQYSAVFALLGTQYGGDGVSTFALPNLNSRVAVGANMGGTPPPGTTPYSLGKTGGADSVTLLAGNLPTHTHSATSTPNLTISNLNVQLPASTSTGNTATPGNLVALAKALDSSGVPVEMYTTGTTDTTIKPANVTGGTIDGTITTTVGATGGSTPFDNRQPYLALNYIICVEGIFPSRP